MANVKAVGAAEKKNAPTICGKTASETLSKVRGYVKEGYEPNEALVITCGFSWSIEHSGTNVELKLLDDEGKTVAKTCYRSESTDEGLDGCIRLMFGIPFNKVPKEAEAEQAVQASEPEAEQAVPTTAPVVVQQVPTEEKATVVTPHVEILAPPKKGAREKKEVFTDSVVLLEDLKEIRTGGALSGAGGLVACRGKRLPMRVWKTKFKGNFEWLLENWRANSSINARICVTTYNGQEQFELEDFA